MYLVQRRVDMLPKPLTEDICSLRGGVDRLAFSVIWEVTPSAEVRPPTNSSPVYLLRVAGSARGEGTAESGQGYMQKMLSSSLNNS